MAWDAKGGDGDEHRRCCAHHARQPLDEGRIGSGERQAASGKRKDGREGDGNGKCLGHGDIGHRRINSSAGSHSGCEKCTHDDVRGRYHSRQSTGRYEVHIEGWMAKGEPAPRREGMYAAALGLR